MRDYWFPDIRSMGGAILVLSAALYPYVYLSARASFVQQSVCVLEVARTLGRTSAGAFWSVALPLARPALAAGVALALMECLNDLGAVQYLGVQTLSVSIYTTWLQHSSLGGAAQIALVALLIVLALMLAERAARGRSQFHHTTGRYRAIPFTDLDGWRGAAAAGFCALPVLVGFAAPFALLLVQAPAHVSDAFAAGFWRAVRNSVGVAACRGGGDRGARPAALPTPAGWRPTPSCASPCAAQASATLCPAQCWRSASSSRSRRSTTASTRGCARLSASRAGSCSRAACS